MPLVSVKECKAQNIIVRFDLCPPRLNYPSGQTIYFGDLSKSLSRQLYGALQNGFCKTAPQRCETAPLQSRSGQDHVAAD